MTREKNNYSKQCKKIIAFDGRCLLDENYTGVSEYAQELLRKIITDYSDCKVKVFTSGFISLGDIKKKLSWLKKYHNVQIKHFKIPNKLLNFCLWFFNRPYLDRVIGGSDYFIAPNISFLSISKRSKFILTFHDLSFERFPETFSLKRRLWHFFVNPRILASRAEQIWTVSYSTKWDLNSLYKIPLEKIKIKQIVKSIKVQNKKDELDCDLSKQFEKIHKKYALPQHFILYLGTIEPRKNILRIIKAFEYLQKNNIINSKYHLVLAGQLGWQYKNIIKYWKQSDYYDKIIMIGFVEHQDKKIIYQSAELFVYPSLFEGFGIPVLESMANGLPVITSNNSSLPEVVGSAGVMIDPNRLGDLVEAISKVLNDRELLKYYSDLGLEQAEKIIKNSQNIELL